MEKRPFLTEEQAQEIIQDVPTPFHVYDEKGIRENARRINKAFSWNKGFREYFAVKALPNPIILQILKEEGCGVDCSSLTELMLSEACGFTGSDIMFSSNQTPVEDMKKAYELGAYINLDDATMVDFLDRVAGIPENIFCRYNPGGTFQLGESEEGFQVMDKPGDAKYGMTRAQIAEAFRLLKAKGAEEFGIHAFLASNTLSNEYYPALARMLFRLAAELQQRSEEMQAQLLRTPRIVGPRRMLRAYPKLRHGKKLRSLPILREMLHRAEQENKDDNKNTK